MIPLDSRSPIPTLALLLATGSIGLAHGAALAATELELDGTYLGELAMPFDPLPVRMRLGLERASDGSLVGAFDSELTGPGLVRGALEAGRAVLSCDFGSGVGVIQLSPAADGREVLMASIEYRGFPLQLELERVADAWLPELHFLVEPPAERPSTVSLAGLPDFWLEEIEPLVLREMEDGQVAGLALALVVDGELLDHRSWGWRDVARELPVDGETLFRWASISKSVTGLVAGKLALAGRLELDDDVRAFVPEFPEKRQVVTTRLLLGHLAGIPHYQHLPPVRRMDYGTDFPFRDPVRAIDMFLEAPLIHEPGTQYSYSTHGYALAGAVIERGSEHGYRGEVQRLVARPLGMTSFEPDDPTARRPARTLGYRVSEDGRLFESGDTDISWKLAGGGFQSTVADLARFGAGLCDEDYVGDELRELIWTPMKTAAGESTGYGLGFRIEPAGGDLRVTHGGAQRRTATFLMTVPDQEVAIALMCNTEGTRLEGLAREIAAILLDE